MFYQVLHLAYFLNHYRLTGETKRSETKEAAQKAASFFATQLNLKLNLKPRTQKSVRTNHLYYLSPGHGSASVPNYQKHIGSYSE